MSLNKPNKIILHCAITPNENMFDISDVDDWHRERGFRMVGYQYFIKYDGTVQKGRREDELGAHCLRHNYRSIGICLEGTDEFSFLQAASLVKLYSEINERWQIPVDQVFGHSEMKAHEGRECPNVDMDLVRGML